MEHPKAIGDKTTLAVMAALRAAGLSILIPFGENTRYDLVVDDGVCLSRVQCKTGRLRGGVVRFRTCSSYAHHPNPKKLRRDYEGQVDYFGVHCPETDGVYLVPIEHLEAKNVACLRVEPTRNGQRKRIRPASLYEIGSVRVRSRVIRAEPGATAGV
jgi:hypothetical protein